MILSECVAEAVSVEDSGWRTAGRTDRNGAAVALLSLRPPRIILHRRKAFDWVGVVLGKGADRGLGNWPRLVRGSSFGRVVIDITAALEIPVMVSQWKRFRALRKASLRRMARTPHEWPSKGLRMPISADPEPRRTSGGRSLRPFDRYRRRLISLQSAIVMPSPARREAFLSHHDIRQWRDALAHVTSADCSERSPAGLFHCPN
jgi:hypothetical protein